jgi:hypothetical protein
VQILRLVPADSARSDSLESTPSRSCGGAKIKQTVWKLGLSGFPNRVREIRIGMAHISGFERRQLLLLP